MSSMFHTMMHNPMFYILLMGVLVLLTVGPLLAIRMLAHREHPTGARRGHDPHLG